MTKKIISVFTLVTCLIAFAFSSCTTTQRGVASDPSDNEMDQVLNSIFKSTNPGQEAVEQYDKLFVLLLKANQFISQFDSELDTKLAFKRKNPGAPVAEPLHSEYYKQLLKVWNLKEKYSHQIEYLYSKCLQMRSDLSLSEEQRKTATLVIKDVTTYLETSRNLKRVELQPIMTDLQKIHTEFMMEYKKNLSLNPKSNIDISAISTQPNFSRNIFANSAAYQQYAAKISENENDALLNSSSYKDLSAEVDRELDNIPDPVFENRTPQSQDLKCGGGKKLCVSTGEDGNAVGGVFPAGIWTFTYDDGPHPAYTAQIMGLFTNYKDKVNPKGKATFFWQAQNVEKYPEYVKKAFESGFPVENHSYSHADLNKLKNDPAALTKQIITSNKIIEAQAKKYSPNYKIQYFRCPYGSCYAPKIPVVRQMLVDQGQIHAYWRIDSLDWKLQDANKVVPMVLKQMQLLDHGIILFHDVQQSTIESTRRVLAWVKEQNDKNGKKYKIVTLPEAVDLTNGVSVSHEN